MSKYTKKSIKKSIKQPLKQPIKKAIKYDNLCKLVSSNIKYNIDQEIFAKFSKYMFQNADNIFQNHKNIFKQILNIHTSLNTSLDTFNIKINYKPLSKEYKIPCFVDILKYILNITKQFPSDNDNDKDTSKLSIESRNKLLDILSNKPASIYKYLNDNSKIGQQIMNIYYEYNINNSLELERVFPELKFHNLLLNSFTSFLVLENLEKYIKKLYTISFTYKNHEYNDIIYLFGYNNLSRSKIIKLASKIVSRLLFFNELLETNKLPSRIIFFLTDMKKEIDNQLILSRHFKTLNINTAVTNGIEIIIYREEELLKSIFHELIHFHNLDNHNMSKFQIDKLLNYIKTSHYILPNNEYLFYESITESLANILNNCYDINESINQNTLIQQFTQNYFDELLFTIFQVAKILKICKINKWQNFIKPYQNSNDLSRISNSFKQDSCVFSYYILKLYILMNFDIYLSNLLDNKLRFILTDKNISRLIEIFELGRNNKYLEQLINSILKYINLEGKINKSKINKNLIITKTLRMTCLDT